MLVVVALGNVIAVVPASRLSDRIGRKPIIYAACLIGAIGVSMTALAPHIVVGDRRRRPVRHVRGDVPRGRLGADDRHHPAGLRRAIHGPQQRRDRRSAPLFAAVIGGIVLDVVAHNAGEATAPRAAFLVAVVLYGIAALLLRPVVEPPRAVVAAGPELTPAG